MDVDVAAIAFDSDGAEEFLDAGFFPGPVLLDESKKYDVYAAFGTARSGICSLLCSSGFWSRSKQAKDTEGNFKGDGFQMGGVFVVGRDGCLLYSYPQKFIGDDPPTAEVIEAMRSAADAVAAAAEEKVE
eukprot:PLAT10289.1.p1 GENE.PLAT10289.1~~PLAT10289.1.p1  ORF type:complete len:130 (+),score=55.22 PLAT10289.1:383-772(+)